MKIFIAENNSAIRYGLEVLLEEQDEVEIVGVVANVKDFLRQIRIACPDLILLSWKLPGFGGKNLIKLIRLICPEVTIIVMSGRPEAADRVLALGADNFVCKAESPERLMNLISHYLSISRQLSKPPMDI